MAVAGKQAYDAVLLVSFGGPEAMSDVIPFLENVLRGRNVPAERMAEVARHYEQFGGISPINEQNRKLIAAIEDSFKSHGLDLPVYWGNRNWHPMLADTLAKMANDGVKNALAFVTSAYGSYSSCRQYLENIDDACAKAGQSAPAIDKLRLYFNHPGFVEANAANQIDALSRLSGDATKPAKVLFSAHSIPVSMAENCLYAEQLKETAALVASKTGITDWEIVYQSRSGPPSQPWLEPDVLDRLKALAQEGITDVLIHPIGFISDHMEVIFDLDTEARKLCDNLGLNMVRAATVGTHPAFVEMIRQLVLEKTSASRPLSLGSLGLSPDQCSNGCCSPASRA